MEKALAGAAGGWGRVMAGSKTPADPEGWAGVGGRVDPRTGGQNFWLRV